VEANKQGIGKDCENYGFQSLNINGRSITNHQIIANTFNDHFTTFPTILVNKLMPITFLPQFLIIIIIPFPFP
jgi:hypothetical protein